MNLLRDNTYIYSIRSDMIYHIYGLYNEDYPHTYIGYTEDLTARLSKHKFMAKTANSKVYKYMREVQGDWKLEVLETHECSKKYAKERERYYKELMGDLNTEVPGRTHKEWREDNPEKFRKEMDRKYARQKLNRYTCECGSNLRWADKARHEKTKSHIAYETQN